MLEAENVVSVAVRKTCVRLSLFSDINISQGSAATQLRRRGIFNNDFLQIYY